MMVGDGAEGRGSCLPVVPAVSGGDDEAEEFGVGAALRKGKGEKDLGILVLFV